MDNELKTIETFLNDWKNQIVKNYIASGQKTTGKTLDSLTVDMNETGGGLTAWKYFTISETGRKPGKVPYNFAEIIMKWAAVKGLSVNRSFGYLLAQKIRKEGTLLYRQGGRKDIYSNVLTESNINKLVEAIGNSFLINVSSTIDNLIKSK